MQHTSEMIEEHKEDCQEHDDRAWTCHRPVASHTSIHELNPACRQQIKHPSSWSSGHKPSNKDTCFLEEDSDQRGAAFHHLGESRTCQTHIGKHKAGNGSDQRVPADSLLESRAESSCPVPKCRSQCGPRTAAAFACWPMHVSMLPVSF